MTLEIPKERGWAFRSSKKVITVIVLVVMQARKPVLPGSRGGLKLLDGY